MATEMKVLKRLISTLSLGYILFFYSETMFWARWRPGVPSRDSS
ncbi:hypothetical protein [Thermococcus thermotolerans]|nr:hypothetical protein [Thermococcus thermotolerans]